MATFTKGKRGDGSIIWRAQVRLKGFPAETATFDSKAEAKQWASHVETEIRAGRRFGVIESRKNTLSLTIDRYKRDILPKKRDNENQARQLDWWREKLGTLALADVTPARVVACRDELARGETVRGKRSPATVNRYLAVLSHLFTVAVKEWQITTENPCTRVAKLKEPRGRVRCLSEGELWRLLAALEAATGSPHLLPIVWIAISTGLRQRSILELKWQDVDLSTGRLAVERTKNEDPIVATLPQGALNVLRKWGEVRLAGTDLIFPSPEIPEQPIEIGKTFPALVKATGIEDFHFHDLRHCVGSFLGMTGATPVDIAAVLGHRTFQMAARYTHVQEAHLAGLLEKMSAKFLTRPKPCEPQTDS